jgi:hypothetical protein
VYSPTGCRHHHHRNDNEQRLLLLLVQASSVSAAPPFPGRHRPAEVINPPRCRSRGRARNIFSLGRLLFHIDIYEQEAAVKPRILARVPHFQSSIPLLNYNYMYSCK